MVEEIIWSPLAVETYDGIIEYLLKNLGEVAVKRFVQHVDDKLKLIASRPTIFRVTGKCSDTYITSIGKRTTLTYRYSASKTSSRIGSVLGNARSDEKAILILLDCFCQLYFIRLCYSFSFYSGFNKYLQHFTFSAFFI